MGKRQCKGTNKQGQPCGAHPIGDGDLCISHSDRETQDRLGFGGPQEGSGRPRRPREIELIQEVAEEMREQIRQVWRDGIQATRHVVVGNGPSAHLEEIPDQTERRHTIEAINDRLHGKPTVQADIAAAVDVNLNLVTDNDLRDQLATVRRRLAAARPVKPSGPDAGDRA